MLTNEEYQRYNRQMLMPEFGQEGQENLKVQRFWSLVVAVWVVRFYCI